MNKIESMMKILFDGETPRLKYSNKLVGRNDMIKRNELYTIIAKDIISGFEHYGLVIKVKDYAQMNDKKKYKLHYTTRDPYFLRHTEMSDPNHKDEYVTYDGHKFYPRRYGARSCITNHIELGKFKEEGLLDKWLKFSGYRLSNKMIYDNICSILRNSYVLAHSSTRDGLHPIAVLERRACNVVEHSMKNMKNIRHFKPILNSCGHDQIDEYDISKHRRQMREKEEAIMMNTNSEIIVDRNTIMSNINYMEELLS
jgi:hypothetical protein